jgi:hypothetical protein
MMKKMNWFNFVIITIIMSMFVITPVFGETASITESEVIEIRDLLFTNWENDFSENLGMLKKNLKLVEDKKNFNTKDGYITCLILNSLYKQAATQISLYDHNFFNKGDKYERDFNKMMTFMLRVNEFKGVQDSKQNRKKLMKIAYEMCNIIDDLRKYL